MVWSEIALICVSIVLVIVVIAWFISTRKKSSQSKEHLVDDCEIIDGVKYTKNFDTIDKNGNANVTLKKGDIMLERGKEYKVGEKGDILAGKYTVLTADENISSVNMRIGGLVRDYKHFSSIVLTDGDIISALSANVILR